MNEIQITKIELNGTIHKGMTLRGPGFIQPVIYTLIDGRQIKSYISNERKKKLPETFARNERSIAAGCMKANFNDAGEFWGTVQTWGMTGSSAGLVPMAH